ncbi:MAG TPA: Dabb family protein [Candidatus Stercoripulliclostridium merdipullorum]|uniref:Dabb family protein n=1 Tax=Candidatus Stercoripulliclostridium merdipullorum TaxID=2840952 RepID=A0A9D1NDC6_9FIRM|nr:Dabb family protein [Candidatus Stercoripulliclostridium merdipullorum]
MVKHIVLFKLKDTSDENIAKTVGILRSMEGNVPMLRGIEVGSDFLHSDRSYDVALIVTLDDRAALEAYQNDPYHCSVVKKHMHAVRSGSVALDFEF